MQFIRRGKLESNRTKYKNFTCNIFVSIKKNSSGYMLTNFCAMSLVSKYAKLPLITLRTPSGIPLVKASGPAIFACKKMNKYIMNSAEIHFSFEPKEVLIANIVD